jgi:hypothetical protein
LKVKVCKEQPITPAAGQPALFERPDGHGPAGEVNPRLRKFDKL